MSMMSGETCNHCGEDLGEVDERVLSVICPHCYKPTGVCANCAWYMDEKCTGSFQCTYNCMPNEMETK